MAAHVEAERFLLERQLLRLGPGRRVGQRRSAGASPGSSSEPIIRRTAGTALIAVALVAAAVLERPVDGGEQPRARAARLASAAARERVERARLDQALEHPLVHQPQIDVLAQREERSIAASSRAARRGSTGSAPSPTLFTAPRPKRTPSGSTMNGQLARVDVGRQDRDAELAALAEVHRQLVGVLRLDREQRRHEVPRVVRLEIRRLVREQRVGRRVRLVEAVAGEELHQVEDLGRLLLGDAVGAARLS